MLSASGVLPPSGTVIDASSSTRADITSSVRASDSHAWVARADVLISATGLSISSPLATTQSSAFFRTPGTPWASLRTRYQDRIARLQRGSESGDRLRCRLFLEVRIEGRKRRELAVDGHFHTAWCETCDSADKRTVRRGPPQAP